MFYIIRHINGDATDEVVMSAENGRLEPLHFTKWEDADRWVKMEERKPENTNNHFLITNSCAFQDSDVRTTKDAHR